MLLQDIYRNAALALTFSWKMAAILSLLLFLCFLFLIYQIFGVMRVKDRLKIKFSQKSKRLRRLFR